MGLKTCGGIALVHGSFGVRLGKDTGVSLENIQLQFCSRAVPICGQELEGRGENEELFFSPAGSIGITFYQHKA